MIAMLLLILSAFAGLYHYIGTVGRQRALHHQISFYEYILQHHVGRLTDIDDGAGFDPNSYVLTLSHRLPDAKIKEYALHLMKLYVKYDRGMALTIRVQVSPKAVPQPMADVVYDDQNHQVTVTVTKMNGLFSSTQEKVNW